MYEKIKESDIKKLNLPYTVTEPYYSSGRIGKLTNGKFCVRLNELDYEMTYTEELDIFKKYVDKRKMRAEFQPLRSSKVFQ